MKTYDCIYCNAVNEQGKGTPKRYCNSACHALGKRQRILKEWLDGTYYNKKGNPPDVAKDWIREKQGNACLLCNITDWNNKPIVFQFDHIDGNPDNNTKENFRMICPNCHSQTDTYGVKNKNAKHSRRNIYRRKNYYDKKN